MSEMMSCIFQVILHNFYKTSSEHELGILKPFFI